MLDKKEVIGWIDRLSDMCEDMKSNKLRNSEAFHNGGIAMLNILRKNIESGDYDATD